MTTENALKPRPLLRRRTDTPAASDLGVAEMLERLTAVRLLASRVAAGGDLRAQLSGLAAAALELTGFTCGQVYTLQDELWTGHGGSGCPAATRCTVCSTDPRFTAFADATVILDRVEEPGATLLADAPDEVAVVLVTPVPVSRDRRAVLVLRSDDPAVDVSELQLELVHTLTTHAALAIEHQRAAEARHDRMRAGHVITARTEELLQVLTHDLRAPLSSIRRAAALVSTRGDALDADGREALLDSIADQSERLERLVQDVSLAVVGDRAELTVDPVELPFVELLREEVARHRETPLGKRLVVVAEPALTVVADRDRTLQVLQNLVDNAERHGNADTRITVVARTVGDEVHVDVTNHGRGIAPHHRETIFEKFGRGPAPTAARGAGLGLYIARRVAQAMGGDVTLVDPGRTTTFRLTLPAPDAGGRLRRPVLADPDLLVEIS